MLKGKASKLFLNWVNATLQSQRTYISVLSAKLLELTEEEWIFPLLWMYSYSTTLIVNWDRSGELSFGQRSKKTPGFQESRLIPTRIYVWKISMVLPQRKRESRRTGWYSKITSSKLKKDPFLFPGARERVFSKENVPSLKED